MSNGSSLMRGPLLALSFVALSLTWLVLFGAGVRQADWNAALLFLGATALFYWTFRSGQTPPRLPLWHLIALWALPCYAVLQLLPLPLVMLEALSPASALIAESLGGIGPNLTHAPISVAPAAAMSGLFSLLGYLSVYSLMRDIEWRFVEARPWFAAAPMILIAAVEAFIGIGQWFASSPRYSLRGTLASEEHFAALLEIALPFTLMFGFISFRRHQTQTEPSSVPAARAATAWLASLMILLALIHSSSETSHLAMAGSLFVLLTLALVPRLKTQKLRRYGAASAVAVAFISLLIIVPPADFVDSLAQLGANDNTSADTRLAVWNNSSAVLNEFRWFGTGIGGFEPTYLKYQGTSDLNRVTNPQNDLLALLINWGIIGALIVLVALAGVMRPAIMGALFLTDEPRRLFAVSIMAALSAALLRSSLQSTLSAPFLAMSFAWLAGLSQSSGLD